MKKYFCIMCGYETNKKYYRDKHLEDLETHEFVKRLLRARILDFILSIPIELWFRLLGGWIIYFIFKIHFNWDFSLIESLLIGFGMGLLMVGIS